MEAYVAGILDLISGAIGLSIALLALAGMGVLLIVGGTVADIPGPVFVPAIIVGLAIVMAIIDILAIAGGVYALNRKKWGLALAGGIAACFSSWPLGIAAIVFTALAKNEFEQ